MSRKIIVPLRLGLKGEYKALVHKGDGVAIRETPWGGNIITATGMDRAFIIQDHGFCVAGDGNATPDISDVNLDSYLGKMSTTISRSGTVNSDPGSGALYLSTIVRTQFIPGAFGGAPVNIAEAGFTCNEGTLAGVNSTTPLFSRGLLVDEFGAPTAVAVQPDEYLDIFWRFTVNLPYNAAGSFNLDIDGVPTAFDFLVRPLDLTPGTSLGTAAWAYVVAASAPNAQGNVYFNNALGTATDLTRNGVVSTGMVAPSSSIATPAANRPVAINWQTYTDGNFYRDVEMIWTLAQGNVGGILTAVAYLGYTEWQVEFDPVISKDDTRQLNLTFRLSIENTP